MRDLHRGCLMSVARMGKPISSGQCWKLTTKTRGLYVKAGQSIGIQVAVLPKPYHVLAQMFDAAEPVPLEAVRNVIHEELGMWPEEIFAEFDPVPIGSAVSNSYSREEMCRHLSIRASPKSTAQSCIPERQSQ